jgi:hypothetical protein
MSRPPRKRNRAVTAPSPFRAGRHGAFALCPAGPGSIGSSALRTPGLGDSGSLCARARSSNAVAMPTRKSSRSRRHEGEKGRPAASGGAIENIDAHYPVSLGHRFLSSADSPGTPQASHGTTVVGIVAVFRAFGALPRLAGCLRQSERVWDKGVVARREAEPCKAISEGENRQDRGSTFSMSASSQPSAARAADGVSGSSASPRNAVRPAAGRCARPRNAAGRPRPALSAAGSARRRSPLSSPPWPSGLMCCPAISP